MAITRLRINKPEGAGTGSVKIALLRFAVKTNLYAQTRTLPHALRYASPYRTEIPLRIALRNRRSNTTIRKPVIPGLARQRQNPTDPLPLGIKEDRSNSVWNNNRAVEIHSQPLCLGVLFGQSAFCGFGCAIAATRALKSNSSKVGDSSLWQTTHTSTVGITNPFDTAAALSFITDIFL
jgi:hypothetical protein